MAPARNVFRSPPGTRHSNGDVTRAGQFMLGFYYEPPVLEADEDHAAYIEKAVEAMKMIHWWRDQHARPLATASQGLRYHVG